MLTVENAWKYLNKIGIYTKKELKDYLKKNPLNVGPFTTPYNNEGTN